MLSVKRWGLNSVITRKSQNFFLFDGAGVLGVVGRIIRFVLLSLLSPLSVVAVDVTVLAHSVCVEFRVGTVPRLLRAAVFVVAVAAHSLRVVLPFGVAAAVRLLSV